MFIQDHHTLKHRFALAKLLDKYMRNNFSRNRDHIRKPQYFWHIHECGWVFRSLQQQTPFPFVVILLMIYTSLGNFIGDIILPLCVCLCECLIQAIELCSGLWQNFWRADIVNYRTCMLFSYFTLREHLVDPPVISSGLLDVRSFSFVDLPYFLDSWYVFFCADNIIGVWLKSHILNK